MALAFAHWTLAQERLDTWVFGKFRQIPVTAQPCPECDLDSDAPEIQHARAKKLQERSVYIREFYAGVDCNYEPFPGPDLSVLLVLAIISVACPDAAAASRTAYQWQVWWNKGHAPVPYDTRKNCDRFFDYVSHRYNNEIVSTPDILKFEMTLVKLLNL